MDGDARQIDDPTTPVNSGGQPLRRVYISDLELVASVGVFEHEKRYLQRVIVSIVLDVIDTYDGRSDEISDVYDYDHAIGAVHATFGDEHVNLIEMAAEDIARRCLEHAHVRRVRVRVDKPDVVAACRAVGIEIERSVAN